MNRSREFETQRHRGHRETLTSIPCVLRASVLPMAESVSGRCEMSEFNVAMVVYGLLQIGLALLPNWWKLAALPSLFVIGPIFNDFGTGGGYFGDLFTGTFAVYGCTSLLAAWLVFGLTKLARRPMKVRLPIEESFGVHTERDSR